MLNQLRYKSWFIVLCAVFPIFVAALLKGTPGKIITSDGNAYYAWLTALTVDQDFDFRNDFMLLYSPDPLEWIERQQGPVKNVTPPGMAIVMSPGFIAAKVSATVAETFLGWEVSPFDPFYKNITAAWLLILYLLGVAAFQRVIYYYSRNNLYSAAFTVTTVLGTNLIHYYAKEPSMSHGAVFALAALATWILIQQRPSDFRARSWVSAGALVGLLLIVRNSTIVLIPWWLALGLRASGPSIPEIRRCLLRAGSAAAVVVAIQPVVMSAMSGRLTLNGYETYGLSSGFEGVWGGLLSSRHGLFAYHPMWLLIFAAVLAAFRIPDLRRFAAAALTSFLGAVLVNGTWPYWWFGDSFGNRSYIDVLAPCAAVAGWSVYALFKQSLKARLAVAAVCLSASLIGANLILWVGYLLRRYPSDGLHSFSEAWLWWLR